MLDAAGLNPPLGGLYQWLVTHYWFLRVFRTSWYSLLGATIFYGVLLWITVDSIFYFSNGSFRLDPTHLREY
ncbi:MAG: hypothetical protein ACUVUB_08065, partial [Candidatus Bathyarchaeia archaeon]